MKNNILIHKEKIVIFFIFLFSLLINQYYGNKGIFPIDSFAHFDTGYKILLGEHPFKDYWAVSGPVIDYFQAIFFYFFGINWQSYIFHASIFNFILSLSTYLVLREFKLDLYYSFFYTIFFFILAYPSSGTPFPDHHSAFFSLLAIYCLILGIKNEKNWHWIMLPILLVFSFLSKQVPATYVIISVFLVLVIFSTLKNKYYWFKYSFLSFFLLISFILIFGKIVGINLSSFLEQYFFYPQSIGSERIKDLVFTFRGIFGNFKFIYIALLPLFFINLKKIILEKKYYKDNFFYYFLVIILFTFSLIWHQVLTKNQTFIFFLIPILFAFSHIYFNLLKIKKSKFFYLFLISVCFFATIKYHIRFNENRKFHELNSVDFELSAKANEIDRKFLGLKWITPDYKINSNTEIELVKDIKFHLKNDDRKIMLLTNYSFFSAILDKKIYSPSRWYPSDGSAYPLKDNKFYNSYKNLIINLIKKNNIEVIYTVLPIRNSTIYTYLDRNCVSETRISDLLNSYELKDCY